MTSDHDTVSAMIREVRRLRDEVAWLRSLPDGAITIEGLVVDFTAVTDDEGHEIERGRILAADGTWRYEQTHLGARGPNWWTRVHVWREESDGSPVDNSG